MQYSPFGSCAASEEERRAETLAVARKTTPPSGLTQPPTTQCTEIGPKGRLGERSVLSLERPAFLWQKVFEKVFCGKLSLKLNICTQRKNLGQ